MRGSVSLVSRRNLSVDGPSSEGEVARVWAVGKAAWPALDLSVADFIQFAARRRPVTALAKDLVGDVFLAAACAHDVPGALQAFRTRLFPAVAQATRAYDPSLPFAE